MKYKALFIDLDGTILDTLKDISCAVNYSLTKHNLNNKTDEQIRTYLGKGSDYLIRCAIDNVGDDRLFKSVYDVYKNYYLNNFATYTKPYDGALNTLLDFKMQGGKIALISNKPQDIAIKLLDNFFPNVFDVIYGQMPHIKTKPDSESLLLAMKDLNINNKEEILYVGDSLVDFQTAKNMGLDVVLCLYGFEDKEKLLNTKANCIASINELRRFY